ncbi:hypothetical protein [uncultured Microbulbifer sp.]|uniref:hypothetical protein n=1 Tax=uncultured Microbulbifer sp. TaxID=348147 RepID=UPI0026098449|nr:hypothetical protein [uncultured Microbulbifer sp.]
MKFVYYGVLSTALSIGVVASAMPIWAVGTHKYGAIASIWQNLDLYYLMAAGCICIILSALSLWKSWQLSSFSGVFVPLLVFTLAALQFVLLFILYVSKVIYHFD